MSKVEVSASSRKNTRPKAGDGYRPGIAPDERRRYIAEAAYFRALQRGFNGGDELADWLAAEAEIDARLRPRA